MKKKCGACAYWMPQNSDDETAPEGVCNIEQWKGPLWLEGGGEHWPTFQYHPNTLRLDYCNQYREEHAA